MIIFYKIFGGLTSGARFTLKRAVLLSLFLMLLVSGCAPSTSSVRYGGSAKEDENSGNTVQRYQEQDTVQAPSQLVNLNEEEDTELEDYVPPVNKIKIEQVLAQYDTLKKHRFNDPARSNLLDKVFMQIVKWYDTPYKYGGTSTRGIDCSAFTQSVYKDAFEIPILRSAREQYTMGEEIEEMSDLEPGDLVFFNTRRRVRPGHVGIYIGDNLFAHASSKLGVTVSSLEDNYYSKRYMGARRIFDLTTGQRTGE